MITVGGKSSSLFVCRLQYTNDLSRPWCMQQLSIIGQTFDGSPALPAQKILTLRPATRCSSEGSEDSWKNDPNDQFRLGKYPITVMEVSYSQKRKALPHLADEYNLDMHGLLELMIGFDIEHLFIYHTSFDIDFCRPMRESLCKICMREKPSED